MDPKSHWEGIYRNKLPTQVSWYQPHARRSLDLIRRLSPPPGGAIIDVGGGASTLIDDLLDAGYHDLTVLDLSAAALAIARRRLGARANAVRWIEADILEASLPKAVRRAVWSGGFVLVATFADDGPTRCSGLEVARYSPEALNAEFGAPFQLMASEREEHVTPAGIRQAFIYCLCHVD